MRGDEVENDGDGVLWTTLQFFFSVCLSVCVFLGFSVLSSFPAFSSIFWEKPPPLFVLLFASPVHFWVFLLWLCFVHPHSPRFFFLNSVY